MLTHPIRDQLAQLGLAGIPDAVLDQLLANPASERR